MKTIKLFSLAALLMAGAAFTACSSDNDILDEQQTVNANGQYKLTIKAGKAATRALAVNGDDIAATWTAGDQVTVYNETKKAALGGYLEAETSGIETTLTGDLTGTIEAGDVLTLKFLSANYNNQQGTLDYIAANCDYATASVTVASVSGGNIVPVAAETEFTNQQAIVKFSLRDSNGSGLPNHTSQLLVEVNNSTIYTVNPANEVNDIFVALPAFNNKTVTLYATVGGALYVYTKTGVTFANGQYYNIPVRMKEGATTLAETLTKAGIVTISYQFHYDTYNCKIMCNGDGTFTYMTGAYDGRSRTLVVEDGKLVFKENTYSDLNYYWKEEGYSLTFDPSNDTYYKYEGSGIADGADFYSVKVNGQTISLTEVDPPAQAKITFADLDTDGCYNFDQIVDKNSSLIYFDEQDDLKIKRSSDDAALKFADKDHPEMEDYVRIFDDYNPEMRNYYFEDDGGSGSGSGSTVLSAALVENGEFAVTFSYRGENASVAARYNGGHFMTDEPSYSGGDHWIADANIDYDSNENMITVFVFDSENNLLVCEFYLSNDSYRVAVNNTEAELDGVHVNGSNVLGQLTQKQH